MSLRHYIHGAMTLAVVGAASAFAFGCASAQLPVAAGDAADPDAQIREEQPPPNALDQTFDPFVAYPELRGPSAGGHHHMHGGEAAAPPAAAPPAAAAAAASAHEDGHDPERPAPATPEGDAK